MGPCQKRVVDFADKTTINDGNGDARRYRKDIAVEGYQKSDMNAHGRSDLQYGILVRNLPTGCDSLVAEVVDVSGNVVSSRPIAAPNLPAVHHFVDFEDGAMPPPGWTALTSTTGTGTTLVNRTAGAHGGARGMVARDASTKETASQRAAIQRPLPGERFAWLAEGWFKPTKLDLGPGQGLYSLHFLRGDTLAVAAGVFRSGTTHRAGLTIRHPDATHATTLGRTEIAVDSWRKWRVRLRRLGTREATAILDLDSIEVLRVNWDTGPLTPDRFRAGIGWAPAGTTSRLLVDDVRVASTDDG
jgi:hypothetical protein